MGRERRSGSYDFAGLALPRRVVRVAGGGGDNERASATLECHSGRINRYVG